MEVIREYILSVTAASMISGILTVLLDKKGTAGAMGKMFCGVFLAITLIRPLGELSFDSVTDWLTEYERQGNQYAVEGEALKNDSVREIIKSRCEAYIQDVGADMKLTLKQEVLDAAGAVITPAVNWNYGAFIQQIVDFAILAFCVFLMVKLMNKLNKKKEEPAPAPAPAPEPEPTAEEKLLTEIRDLLKERK